MATAYEIRRILKMYDDSAVAQPRIAVQLLRECTKAISAAPAKYDLTSEEPEVWEEAGGLSYGEAAEFPCLLGARWMEVLQKPGVQASTGMDKDEWAALLKDVTDYEAALVKAELSLEVLEEFTELVGQLREAAPEPEDSDEDEDEDDDEEEDD